MPAQARPEPARLLAFGDAANGHGPETADNGLSAHNVCVQPTARDAMQRGYQVTLLEDGTTAFDELIRRVSLLNMELLFGEVRPVESVIREIKD